MGYNGGLYNLYEYVGNDPTDEMDPEGLQEVPNNVDRTATWSIGKITGHDAPTMRNSQIGYSFAVNLVYGADKKGLSPLPPDNPREFRQIWQLNTLNTWYVYSTGISQSQDGTGRSIILDVWKVNHTKERTPIERRDDLSLTLDDVKTEGNVSKDDIFFFSETVHKLARWNSGYLPVTQNQRTFRTEVLLGKGTTNGKPLSDTSPEVQLVRDSITDLAKLEYNTTYFWVNKDLECHVSQEDLMKVEAFIKKAGFEYADLPRQFSGYTIDNYRGAPRKWEGK